MFDEAESDPIVTEADAKRVVPKLRTQLLRAQYRHLQKRDRALLILVSGVDGAGKGDTVNLLNEWMDPRHIRTLAFTAPTLDEQAYPPMYRFWRNLPAKGNIGIVFGSGYTPLIIEASKKRPNADRLQGMLLAARRFEADLIANGVQVIKLWFHLSRQAQRERTKTLLLNPSTAWKVNEQDRKVHHRFDRLRQAGQRIIEASDSVHAPWIIIPAADENARNIRTGQAVLQALEQRRIRIEPLHDPAKLPSLTPQKNPIASIDFSESLAKDDYERLLLHWQNRLAEVVRRPEFLSKPGLILVFEGQDAAGKGSTIRRITKALDARQYEIVPVAAPKPFELDRPYLWRFWRHLPKLGRITIFDRSWYGRVLVERVEKLITPATWRRAYPEINAFESQLTEHGVRVLKFWLAITPDEQLRRFNERQKSPFKQFKITDEDWRNRDKWKAYEKATTDMLVNTQTELAPWHIIAANDKRHARIEILKHIVQRLEADLKNGAH
jgi:polyphosphate:AMP phosphotransferase